MDVTQPMTAVRWTLNYDLREFDTVWNWLHSAVPPGPERARAIGAAGLIAVAELERPQLGAEALKAFDESVPAFPNDARLPLWRAFVRFLLVRDGGDQKAIDLALDELRATSIEYPSFTPFGMTLAIGGWANASPELLDEANKAFERVVGTTYELQRATEGQELNRSRRIWDSPIAPYNLPAMQAMIGDLAARRGDVALAQRSYFTSIHLNNAPRWPWRAEVQRRLENADAIVAGFKAKPATTYALGSMQTGSIGVPTAVKDTRFGGRIGNGSCTVCHSHVSVFDEGQPATEVGWIRVAFKAPKGLPNAQPVAFALPDGKDPLPAGFAFGPTVDTGAGSDFDTNDALFDNTMLVPAKPGSWFVALQTELDGQKYQGYSAREFGLQRFFDVKAGEVIDFTQTPIEITPLK